MKILGIDPGGTTGLFFYQTGGVGAATFLWYGEVETHYDVYSVLLQFQPDVVVMEDFTPRPGVRTMQKDAMHIIGGVEALGLLDITTGQVYMQTPTQAKSFSTNDKMKKVGFYKAGMGHATDAARHVLVWACTNRSAPADVRDPLLRRLVDDSG